ncbi:tRNA dihydrouridine synthase DusB [bacterium]|nr:tRNA dihydrouridine synthase DusB [bacterium]
MGKIAQAPMAGVSDSAFRRICRRLGSEITWSEMVSAEGLARGGERTMRLMRFLPEERPLGIQLFGAEPGVMERAAQHAAELEPDFIDLNFGCPVPKVIRRNGGSSLLKDPPLLERVARSAVRGAGGVPVCAKIRSGWNSNSLNYLEIGLRLFDSGVAAVTIHARTREQGYSGQADWEHIRRMKEIAPVPVIGSGDIVEPQDARRMLTATGCDSVMLGRALLGNPWLAGRVRRLLDCGEDPGAPSLEERFRVALEHLELSVEPYGQNSGVIQMRKHLGWYTRGLPGGAELRRRLFAAPGRAEVRCVLLEYLEGRDITVQKTEGGAGV